MRSLSRTSSSPGGSAGGLSTRTAKTLYCDSTAPDHPWKKGIKERWTCEKCGRTGLLIRQRHLSWPPPVRIPVYGETGRARTEVVAYALVSPIDAWLQRYKWRQNRTGYIYRPSSIGGRRPGAKSVNIYIQRQILGLQPGDPLEGHHKDDDPQNNQRWNLETVTRSVNELYKHHRNVRNGVLSPIPIMA